MIYDPILVLLVVSTSFGVLLAVELRRLRRQVAKLALLVERHVEHQMACAELQRTWIERAEGRFDRLDETFARRQPPRSRIADALAHRETLPVVEPAPESRVDPAIVAAATREEADPERFDGGLIVDLDPQPYRQGASR